MTSPERGPGRLAIGGLFAVAAGLHALYLSFPGLDSDQAIVGLMGLHVLRGEFPVFFWGEAYSGTAESFLAAPLFWLLGPSRHALGLAPAAVSLAFVWVSWKLAREIFGDRTARIALALLAVPPAFLSLHGSHARGNYIENLFLGSTCLLLAVRLGAADVSPARARRLAILLGGLAGLAWYMSFQSLPYLVAASGYLAWRKGRRLWPLAAVVTPAFLVGSAPLWLYNLSSGFGSLDAVRVSSGTVTIAAGVQRLGTQLPILLGARAFPHGHDPAWGAAAAALAWAAGAVSVAGILVATAEAVLPRAAAGARLLVASGVLLLGVVLLGGFSANAADPRYLLPLCSVAPLLLARALGVAWRWPPLVIPALAVVLGSHVMEHASVLARDADLVPRYRAEDRRLLDVLRARGHAHAYAPDHWLSYRLTFDAGENPILATPFWRDRPRLASKYPPYTYEVRAAPAPAYVVSGRVSPFRATLGAAGVPYETTRIGRFSVLDHFRRPPDGWRIPSAAWRARGPAGRLAFDRNPDTAYRGTRLRIDLGDDYRLTQVVLLLAAGESSPGGAVLEGSPDGHRWRRLAEVGEVVPGFAWIGDHLALEEPRRVALRFEPAAVRHLRLRTTSPERPIAVAELFAYEEGPAVAAPGLQEGIARERARQWPEALTRYAEAVLDDRDDEEALHRALVTGRELGLEGWAAIFDYLSDRPRSAWPELRLQFAHRYWELAGERETAWRRLAAVLAEVDDAGRMEPFQRTLVGHFTPQVPLSMEFGRLRPTTRFLGYTLRAPSAARGESVEITSYWRVERPSRDPEWVSVQLHDGRRVRLTQDRPLLEDVPTRGWRRGEVVRHTDRVAIPRELKPGVYHIRLGVGSRAPERKWRVWHDGWPTARRVAEIGALTVEPAIAAEAAEES